MFSGGSNKEINNKYTKDQMKLGNWLQAGKNTKDNQYNSNCKHTNLNLDRNGKLIWYLSVTMDVIE